VYINTDGNGRGFLDADGSHTLEKFINGVAKDIQDPEKKISVWQRARSNAIVESKSEDDRKEVRERADLRIPALGSGSDYTVFIDHLGIASLNLAYDGEDHGGIYHSIYDDFYWYTHFSDTDFSYGRALSQTAGTAVLRLADADVLPYEFTDLADTVHKYTDELQKLLKKKQDEIVEQNKELADGDLVANADPKKPYVPPAVEAVPPHLNFAPLLNVSDALTHSAERYQKALEKITQDGHLALGAASIQSLNAKLVQSERKLTSADGLPGRPWFKHMVYAPGFYTGYGVKTIPGVREAIEQKKWQEADQQIGVVSAVLQDEVALIDSASAELENSGGQ
jgi:N-acetylated-alpha-linked acidic dipeptidase